MGGKTLSLLVLATGCLATGCATSTGGSYYTSNRIECGANVGLAYGITRYAANVERQTGYDVDAYGKADQFAFWSNMFLAGFNAASSGRAPDGDDVCHAINETSDFVYDEY